MEPHKEIKIGTCVFNEKLGYGKVLRVRSNDVSVKFDRDTTGLKKIAWVCYITRDQLKIMT